MTSTDNKIRPYWHIDLKWVFGILTTFFLLLTLTLSVLSNLTSEKIAIPIETFIVASQFSRNGIDDPKEIEETKQKFLSSQEDVFYPLENDKNVSVTRSDLETLSPRELRLKIFRQVVEPFYYGKIDEKTKKQAGILAFINQKIHQTISQIFLVSIIPVILSIIGLVFFSYRYGRLISPAVVFLLVSTIPSILLFLITSTKPAQGKGGPIPFLPYEATQQIAASISQPYYALFFAGIGLIGFTFILRTLKLFSQKRSK